MIHHTTAIIAKVFREAGVTFNIEQRGPYSCVNVNLVPELSYPDNILRFISSEDKVELYMFNSDSPRICEEDFPGFLLACNDLNRVIPHLRYYVHKQQFIARYELPSCITEDQLGAFCLNFLEDIKAAYPTALKILISWLRKDGEISEKEET